MQGGKLDLEWVQLLVEARELGLSLEEVQTFLVETKEKKELVKETYEVIKR